MSRWGPFSHAPFATRAAACAVLAAGLLFSCGDADSPGGGAPLETPSETDSGPAVGKDASAPIDAARTDAGHDAAPIDWTVNGHALTQGERDVVTIVATDVVPRMTGSRDEQLTLGARGAWWALKEGTWEQPLPAIYSYSNCNTATGDKTIGPLEICGSGRAWQVGLAAVQVPGHTAADLETLAAQLFPGTAPGVLLAGVAANAGESQTVNDAIVASTGSLRASWLLRVPAIGFAVVVPGEVVPECIEGAKSWCFGTGWDETQKFAPTQSAALVSIADLRRILSALAP